jgi:hypothetical protein
MGIPLSVKPEFAIIDLELIEPVNHVIASLSRLSQGHHFITEASGVPQDHQPVRTTEFRPSR